MGGLGHVGRALDQAEIGHGVGQRAGQEVQAPVQLLLAQLPHAGGAFIRVIARAYAEKNDSLRKFLSDQYGHVLREFAKAIAACVRELSKEELYWRLDFLAGALTYAMADFGLIKRPANVAEATHRERAARELIRFAAAGFRS